MEEVLETACTYSFQAQLLIKCSTYGVEAFHKCFLISLLYNVVSVDC